MNVGQNLSAIFNSPQLAEVALQAVQAGELAEFQLAAGRQTEDRRRESQVSGAARSSDAGGVEPHTEVPVQGRPGRRGPKSARKVASPAGEEPAVPEVGMDSGTLDGHRIDLVA